LVYVADYTGQQLGNTTVVDLSKPNVLQLIQARSGLWTPSRWTFNNANLYTISKAKDLMVFNHFGQFQLDNLVAQQGNDSQDGFHARFLGFFDLLRTLQQREAAGEKVTKTTYITLWEKITLPLSCLALILNAVPLALAPPRSGEQRGFMFALAMMFLFYLLRSLCVSLGQSGLFALGGILPLAVNGLIAAWLPVLFLAITGLWLLRRKSFVL
jgi:lipopolysaccharide export LptBFGC system permease protein LptF